MRGIPGGAKCIGRGFFAGSVDFGVQGFEQGAGEKSGQGIRRKLGRAGKIIPPQFQLRGRFFGQGRGFSKTPPVKTMGLPAES